MFASIYEVISNDFYIRILTIAAVVIFFVTLAFYLWIKIGMNSFSKKLNEVSNQEGGIDKRIVLINEWFKSSKSKWLPGILEKSWKKFYWEYSSTEEHYIPDVYESFKEDQIVYKYGRRKLVETLPAVFVSLGILGTFWGITSGITGINSNAGVDELQGGINTLLSGMEFAFYSSIAGIVISLIYQLCDRIFFYRMISKNFDLLMSDLDKAFPIKTEGSLLEEMVKTQQEQMNDLKTFFADEFVTKLTTGISETVQQSLNPHLERSNEIMETVVQNTTEAQGEKLNEMVNYFVESLNEVTGDHMKDLGEALNKTVEWQEKVHGEMSALVEELSNVAEKQSEMAKNTTDLSEQMNEYTETLSDYQGKLITSTQELSSITEQNTSLLEQMRSLSHEMNDRHKESEDNFANRLDQMNHTMKRITELGAVMNDMQEETKTTIESLSYANESIDQSIINNTKLTDSLVDQHEISNQWSVKTQSLLEDLVENSEINESMHTNMKQLFERITEERETLDNTKQEHMDLLQRNVQELKYYWTQNSEALVGNREQFEALNNRLDQSMNDFADHMQRGVQRTFEQFDKELKTAVEYLARGVGGINQVVESMEQDIDSVNGQISRFNQSLEQIAAGVEKQG
ncbi:Chromosome partition protein Smc [Paraliobacillus sp. PM-2]|uniref:anti-phage ZorAB system protein ZorA n=1 Tax=Paraliobacillus sp. PM-2 TaxID=1462524 RepID=UPI00061BC611|nr:anti-phage ZorAB system protein ZorA [Paraliobacillus sp. PM-2]CQR46611.1 Chromosome partition protein Smc [Paraliobacillus sp. PM-2]